LLLRDLFLRLQGLAAAQARVFFPVFVDGRYKSRLLLRYSFLVPSVALSSPLSLSEQVSAPPVHSVSFQVLTTRPVF
jgi:hypothetical protein